MCAKPAKAHQGREQTGVRRRPETRSELHQWVRARLRLPVAVEQELLEAVDQVLLSHERLWRESKEQALHAVAAGFAQRLDQMRDELLRRDARTSKVAEYFEHLVHELTDQVHRDAKTQLLTFRRFMERVAASLGLDQRGRWCAMGMIDIASFKSHNDTLGHTAGDRIIERVAHLLRSEVRCSDLVANEAQDLSGASQLHARFGGDEFCFFLSNLEDPAIAWAVAERFGRAVAQHDWSVEDSRLITGAVNVDIGVVCLLRGPASERRGIANQITHNLLDRADMHLYEAKRNPAAHVSLGRVRVHRGELVELGDNE
jgi:diguanylate cyclase (GGDEF)-like protein